tara:strand:- start:8984 stop:9673 length:690 start_codon:yes stop_codon:yes gene_type:complete
MSTKKKTPPTQITQPETFILESLNHDDELASRLDGKVLYDVLKLHGKNPLYYYFRTQRELIEFAKLFRESGYRYLHLSCHGSTEIVQYTFGESSYNDFARMFDKRLNNRRLFVSGCNLGNKNFAEALFNNNGGMYSVTAPIKKVHFDQSISFWSAFYYMMHAWDTSAMKKRRLTEVLNQLSTIFEMPLAHYFKDTSKAGAVAEQIFTAKRENLNISPVKGQVLAGEVEI